MKRNTFILTAAALGIAALAATTTLAHGPGYGGGNGPGNGPMQGQGMMQGQGQMQGHGYGMGQGMKQGGGPYGGCANAQTLDTPLTIDDVRANLEAKLEARGNDRLKVGTVVDKDDTTISAQIVTVDDSLVRTIEIDKTTGRHTPVR